MRHRRTRDGWHGVQRSENLTHQLAAAYGCADLVVREVGRQQLRWRVRRDQATKMPLGVLLNRVPAHLLVVRDEPDLETWPGNYREPRLTFAACPSAGTHESGTVLPILIDDYPHLIEG